MCVRMKQNHLLALYNKTLGNFVDGKNFKFEASRLQKYLARIFSPAPPPPVSNGQCVISIKSYI